MMDCTNRHLRFWVAGAVTIALISCAQIRGLEGGERDTRPPELLSSSPPNFTIDFRERTIILVFDEYVQLNSLAQELVISPPLSRPISGIVKKRSVILTIDEVLIPNTTYILNFGNAIVDFTEGNRANVQYVFSTGSVIDSLVVEGRVTDAWTGKPEEGARVMLYPDTSETHVLTSMPLYLARTNSEGQFRLAYLAAGNYYLAAIAEETENYKLDPGERLAFLPGLIEPGVDDSTRKQVHLTLSPDRVVLKQPEVVKADSTGFLRVFWPSTKDTLMVVPDRSELNVIIYRPEGNDTLLAWLSGPSQNRMEKMVIRGGEKADTVYIPYFDEAIRRPLKPSVPDGQKVLAGESVRLRWPVPATVADLSSVVWILPDSSERAATVVSSAQPNEWSVGGLPTTAGKYRLKMNPNAIRSIHETAGDSLELTFTIPARNELGVLALALEGEGSMASLRSELRDSKGRVKWSGPVTIPSAWNVADLFPGDYEWRIWEDDNGDQRWTITDFASRVAAERMWVYPQKISVRANWEMEVRWSPD